MNILTEQLQRRHLPLLSDWLDRSDGALTPNDLPARAEALAAWFDRSAAQPGRLDCLTLVYETPVGVASLLPLPGQPGAAELRVLLGEVGYNALRTGTYVALQMLDRAFLDLEFSRAAIRVYDRHAPFLQALERMGFSRTDEREGLVFLAVGRDDFLRRKYLF